jgi:DNA helicase IV
LKHIQQKFFLGLLHNPFRTRPREITLRDNDLIVQSKHTHRVHLGDLKQSPTIKTGVLGCTVSILIDTEAEYILKGVKEEHAVSFSETVQKQWVQFNTDQLEDERQSIDDLLHLISNLSDPEEYPSACLLSPSLKKAKRINTSLLSKLSKDAISQEATWQIGTIQNFIQNFQSIRTDAISAFEEKQLRQWKEFFDTFESNPLTLEQRTSIITDENATLVLAGAGSGKTSVITAKAGYLLRSRIRKPEEILLLAFAKNAAKEMSERIKEKCGELLEARTFHSLAYEIIGTVEGSKPALAAHATDNKVFLALIREILETLARTNVEISKEILRWFSHSRLEDKSQWDFETAHEYYQLIEKTDLRTLQGEQVKSFEELMIANWLFENGIEYEYEPDYEHKVSNVGLKDYCPDFRLKNSGVYIEHFGVRKQKIGGISQLITAPFVDCNKYLETMNWKRTIHKKYETTLIETFSYERQDGMLLIALAEKIAPYEEVSPRSPETLFDRIIELNQADSFVELMGIFLVHYKGGGYMLHECIAKGEKLKIGRRAKVFLLIFETVYEEYQKLLGSRIDFEDMILRATQYVKTGKYRSQFRHILVDEFQDISRSRGFLIKALKSQHKDAHLFGVGDDWQSIYRFAGSDINLMRNFGAEFGSELDGQTDVHRTIDLGRTFRSIDLIAHAAKLFVLQNPAQLDKQVIPAGVSKKPAISVVSTFKHDTDQKLTQVLGELSATVTGGKKISVLLLGRYRFLAPDDLPILKRKFPKLEINFKTIHSSKGLEADHVIMLDLYRGKTGFPSGIVDDPLLSLVSPETEPYENAEERRVMYVALTRARKTVTLMSSASRPSAFVSELLDQPEYGVVSANEHNQKNHTCDKCSGHLVAFLKKDGSTWYRCEHADLCGNTVNPCGACGRDIPQQQPNLDLLECSCGAEYLSCPSCDDGWLVEREGRFGPFLGCVRYPNCKGK